MVGRLTLTRNPRRDTAEQPLPRLESAGAPDAESHPDAASANVSAICVLSSCMPLAMMMAVVILRRGFPTPVRGIVELAGFSLLIINAAVLARPRVWYLSGFMLSTGALLALTLLGFSPLAAIQPLSLAIAGLGVVLAAWNLLRTWKLSGIWRTLAILLLGAFLSLHLTGFYWGGGQHDLLYPEAVTANNVRIDTAEQAAVVSMISTYSVASTGIDGLVRLKYHNGSFWIAEAFSRLARIPAVQFISFGYGLLVVPFYVAMFFQFAEALRSSLQIRPARLPAAFWFVGVVALIGLVPYESNVVRANYNIMILNSDSFILGLALTFAVAGMAALLYRSFPLTLLPTSAAEKTALAVALPFLLILIGWVKIPLTYMVLALLGYLWCRFRALRNWPVTAGIAVSSIAFLAMMRAESGANISVVRLFNFDRVPPEWVPYFFLIHFLWAWIFLLVWAHHHGIKDLADLKAAISSKSTVPLELVLIAGVAGLLPYFVLYFNTAVWVYFTCCHAFLAAAFIMALQPEFHLQTLKRSLAEASLSISAILTGALVVIIVGHLGISTFAWSYRMLKRDGEVRALLAGRDPAQWRSALRLTAGHAAANETLALHQQVLGCLAQIAQQPRQQRQVMALYIPKTNRSYWDLRQSDSGATPFLAPAFSGVVMVDGLPEFEDIGYAAVGWGYPQFHLPKQAEAPQEKLDEAIAKARLDGFRQLMIFRGVSAAGCALHVINVK